MTATATRAATAATTKTYQRILYVTRKLLADLLGVLADKAHFSNEHAKKIVDDIRTLLDEQVLDRITFVWFASSTKIVLRELTYTVRGEGFVGTDAPSGALPYRQDLLDATFQVRVSYNDRWSKLGAEGQQEIRSRLVLAWSSASALTYNNGSTQNEHAYAKDGYALTRTRYEG
jgi:hypothetical protein